MIQGFPQLLKCEKLFAATIWSGGVLRYAERWLLNFGVALVNCPIVWYNQVNFLCFRKKKKCWVEWTIDLLSSNGILHHKFRLTVIIPVPFQKLVRLRRVSNLHCSTSEYWKIRDLFRVIIICKHFHEFIENWINTGKLEWEVIREPDRSCVETLCQPCMPGW